jgi:hypothetical protein
MDKLPVSVMPYPVFKELLASMPFRPKNKTAFTWGKEAGVYGLYSIKEDKYYFGSSIGLLKRLKDHLSMGAATNSNLRSALLEQGLNDFILLVLVVVPNLKNKEKGGLATVTLVFRPDILLSPP